MNKTRLTVLYLFFDILAAVIAWIALYCYRKHLGEQLICGEFSTTFFNDPKAIAGIFLCPLYWVFLHAFTGYYNRIYGKSRLNELFTTFTITLFGSLVFFFVFIFDDIVTGPYDYVKYLLCLFIVQFLSTYIPRVFITTCVNRKIHRGAIGYNTILFGNDDKALQTYESIIRQHPKPGYFLLGYVSDEAGTKNDRLDGKLPYLGTTGQMADIVKEQHVEVIIIAMQNTQSHCIEQVIALARENRNLTFSIPPQTQDVLFGKVKTSSVMNEPMLSITPEYLPYWQKFIKRAADIVGSLFALALLSPLYLILAIGVKRSSPGPVFYKQERIGCHGKPFHIIKFRTMYVDAEAAGPRLSSREDTRITPFGKFLREHHLDETPQFFNVLVGNMSLVGPRPERQYYIDKIVERAPYYYLLQGIKPGITSWGQVKFGYAENVDEMIERLRWDLLYIENMSLQMDVKILIYTVLIVLKKDGK